MSVTKVKSCGLTNIDDALFAAGCGADMLGFIFYEPSPRYVTPEAVAEITTTLRSTFEPAQTPKFVGVFVDHDRAFVEQTLALCKLNLAQLHGHESPDFLRHFDERAFKAANPRSLQEAETLARNYLGPGLASLILLDAYHPTLRGGTGHTGDWSIAHQISRRQTLLLAGGLNPNNVAQAIQAVQPWAVDVSSGVEATKGKKDHTKVKAFIDTVKRKTWWKEVNKT